jgi:hypothetical protein
MADGRLGDKIARLAYMSNVHKVLSQNLKRNKEILVDLNIDKKYIEMGFEGSCHENVVYCRVY